MSVYDEIDVVRFDELKAQGYSVSRIADIMEIPSSRLQHWWWLRKQQKRKRKCFDCKFRASSLIKGANCDYISITGHMRGCPADACTRYEPGARIITEDEKE